MTDTLENAATAADNDSVEPATADSTLIEFPGAHSLPQWRKELSERVREIRRRKAYEVALKALQLPFGEEIPATVGGRTAVGVQGYGSAGARQKFTGKERDSETGLDYFGARYYSAPQGRFTSVDPMLASAKPGRPQTWNRYAYVLNNPLRLIDPTGEMPQESDKADHGGFPTMKQLQFSLRHPQIALRIGTGTERFSISTAAINFSNRTKLRGGEGGQVNAVRHVLWQAMITAKFGAEVADRAGNAHEANAGYGQRNARNFGGPGAAQEADQVADLLNNKIGPQLGAARSGDTPQQLAQWALDYYHISGLFTVTPLPDGMYKVEQTRLTDAQYTAAVNALNGLNEWGRTPQQEAARQRESERIQAGLMEAPVPEEE